MRPTTSEDADAAADLALIELAEAEAAEAEARVEAAQAQAKAARLRLELLRASTTDGAESSAEMVSEDAEKPVPQDLRRRRLGWRTVIFAVALLALAALLAVNGVLAWHHYTVTRDRDRAAEFVAAARQGVVNMTTLDYTKADADVARVLDGATGDFRTDFASRVDDFTKVVRDSKAVTTGTVNATAVESMTRDSAVILVAASSTVTKADGTKEEPRKWRLSVTVTRDGDRLKMSKVEFVP